MTSPRIPPETWFTVGQLDALIKAVEYALLHSPIGLSAHTAASQRPLVDALEKLRLARSRTTRQG